MESSLDRVLAMSAEPDEVLISRMQAFLRELLLARRADGSWVPPELLQEILRSSWLILEDRVHAVAGEAGPRSDTARMVAAWRTCADHLPTLESILTELRADQDTRADPSNYLLDDLALLRGPLPGPDKGSD